MVDRHEQLVDVLAQHDGWLTAADLGARLGVTDRSIRGYVAALNSGSDAPVIESGPSGYRLDRGEWARRLRDDRGARAETPTERATAVLRALLDAPPESEGVDLYELAERLHVSDSTLETDLARARSRAGAAGLTIVRTRERVQLEGPETARRRLIGALFRDEATRGMREVDRIESWFAAGDLTAFKTALIARLVADGYEINDYGLSTVLLHLAIAVDRSQTQSALPARGGETEEGVFAAIIDELVADHFDVKLPPGDLDYLGFLLGTRVAVAPLDAGPPPIDDEQLAEVRAIVEKAAREYLIDLDGDGDFLLRLAMHIRQLVRRAQEGSFSRNPLTRSIKSGYPMIYELAVYIARELQISTGIDVPEDEIAFLAMHLGARLEERRQTEQAVTATIVAPAYHRLHLELLHRVESAVGHDLRIEQLDTRSDVDWDALPGDLIISVIDPPTPSDRIIVVHPFLGEADVKVIQAAISRTRRGRRRARLAERLGGYFDERLFFRELYAPDAEAMIRILGEKMIEAGIVDDTYVTGAIERERLSSTAFTDGLAMPHAMAMTAERTAIALVLNTTSMQWGGSRVEVVAFIAFSESGRASFQEVFDQLVEVFSDRENVRTLVARATDVPTLVAELTRLIDT
ncbi:transcription antiterminator [Homoserinibacter sp. GY 40078]|uniref:BglG family transcription antiterminator n=1 Tax=Homoserinibacter sp. GY 40078 TaxID=2603275 RepID=UPI0011CA1747|nr:PTS sugar transporter subunit IIA [Homoserinibacter sp. GY 40078]TXK19187.1 PRD domain-containing protein [Homoserinibacter sp. GY 40078]